jgi:hypothetical protein
VSGSDIETQEFLLASDPTTSQHFWNRHPTRIVLDRTGFRVEWGPTRSSTLRWDDPNLWFLLTDWREAVAHPQGWILGGSVRQIPFELNIMPPGTIILIPAGAFLALTEAARSAGLLARDAKPSRHRPPNAHATVYSRRPTKWG